MLPVKTLPLSFYLKNDVVHLAKALIGKILVTSWEGKRTAGRIVETEAYAGELDKASHAYKGRTPRTEVMFGEGGKAYVYLCYGLHQMFNIVTGKAGVPHAILVRAAEPLEGIATMLERTGKQPGDLTVTRGPGNVAKAFGFSRKHNGASLLGQELYIMDDGCPVEDRRLASSPRIGVAYAGEHALWPYRFFIKGNPYVSGKIR